MSSEVRVLVVANKTAATPALIEAVRERAARGDVRFTLLIPNAAHGLHALVDPEDQSSGEAESTLELALPLLEQAAGAVDAIDSLTTRSPKNISPPVPTWACAERYGRRPGLTSFGRTSSCRAG